MLLKLIRRRSHSKFSSGKLICLNALLREKHIIDIFAIRRGSVNGYQECLRIIRFRGEFRRWDQNPNGTKTPSHLYERRKHAQTVFLVAERPKLAGLLRLLILSVNERNEDTHIDHFNFLSEKSQRFSL